MAKQPSVKAEFDFCTHRIKSSMSSSGIVNRDQKRAQQAFACVSAVATKTWAASYGRQCLRLPMLLQHSGLCQTIAFLQSKSKGNKNPEFAQVLHDLALTSGIDAGEIASRSRQATAIEYVLLSREAIRSATWLKRYAEALLRVEPGEDEGTL